MNDTLDEIIRTEPFSVALRALMWANRDKLIAELRDDPRSLEGFRMVVNAIMEAAE
jgi:hypothetical protein